MAFYRLNTMARCVKGGMALAAVRSPAVRFAAIKTLLAAEAQGPMALSVAPMSHGPFIKPMHGTEEHWKKWKSWKDIPDDFVLQHSPRDPDNPVYKHPTYIKIRKRQIWYQLPNDTPVWLKEGSSDYALYIGSVLLALVALLGTFYEHYKEIYLKYYPGE